MQQGKLLPFVIGHAFAGQLCAQAFQLGKHLPDGKQSLDIDLRNRCAAPRGGGKQPLCLKLQDRFAHRCSRYRVRGGERSLIDRIARLQLSSLYGPFDGLSDRVARLQWRRSEKDPGTFEEGNSNLE